MAKTAPKPKRRNDVAASQLAPAATRALQVSVASRLKKAGHRFEAHYFWHANRDPYVLFLAEFFLRRSNRTTVARFLPAFVERFPDVQALANAQPQEVVAATRWAGLSQRTRSLPEIMSSIGQRDSWTANELQELPHIGPYAANSIALYVYGEPRFPVDNNVRRVLGRSLGLEGDGLLSDAIAKIVRTQLRQGGVEDVRLVHMGLLAIGWDHCRTAPRCEGCPLSDVCQARAELNVAGMVS